MNIRKGDKVKVLSGKDRGKIGNVTRVFASKGRVLVDGVNLKKRHRRSRRQDKKGEIVLLPAPLDASNLGLICPNCSKPTRVGYKADEGIGKKSRICKKCGQAIQ